MTLKEISTTTKGRGVQTKEDPFLWKITAVEEKEMLCITVTTSHTTSHQEKRLIGNTSKLHRDSILESQQQVTD
jgi:hypothetical protein